VEVEGRSSPKWRPSGGQVEGWSVVVTK